jgi:hypothetical protein
LRHFHAEVNGATVTGPVTVPDTGGRQIWQTVATPGIQLSPGTHVIRVVLETVSTSDGAGNFNWFRLVPQ